jgi:murein L,D-transpeptidase YafK
MKKLTAIIMSLFLAACISEGTSVRNPARSAVPQSPAQVQANQMAGVKNNSPVLIRIFKSSRELEMWRQKPNGEYTLVRTFAICTYSGELGPKKRQGDRQAPEGFYEVGPRQMNPQSIEWLSFDTGFPNAYDRHHGYTGSALMIHGGCSSRGCYAVTDSNMEDIYAAMRDAFAGGQRNLQVQIYPFRMHFLNMFFRANGPHEAFWQQLKAGYDKFNLTNRPLDVKVVNGRYQIN